MVNFKKLTIGLSALAAILLVTVIVLSVVLGTGNSNNDESKKNICTTKACINAANNILNNIDETADPCQNFNKFACGNFIKEARIPDDASSVDSFTDLRNNLANRLSDLISSPINTETDIVSVQNAKRFYKSCVDEEKLEEVGVSELKRVVRDELGGFPLLSEKDNLDEAEKEDMHAKLLRFRRLGLSPLFNVYISSNPVNPRESNLRMAQARWFFNFKYYESDEFVQAYKLLMKNVLGNLNPNAANLDKDIESIYSLEKELASKQLSVAERRELSYAKFNLSELNQKFPGFDHTGFVRGLFDDLESDIVLTDQEPILADELAYIGNVSEIYDRVNADPTEKRTMLNLMGWYFVKNQLRAMPKQYRDYYTEFNVVYSGSKSAAPRKRICANDASASMPYAVGRLYVSEYFDEDSKNVALEMIENIRKEFKKMIDESVWMDAASKVQAQAKADLIDPKIGYPDFTYNDTHLDDFLYKGYHFAPETYLNNSLTESRESFKFGFKRLRAERDRKRWISGPAIVNAFYSSELNQICFPAGILQAPFYDARVPRYLNYGGIGSVIGHEITHGFDDRGRRYNKDGVYVPDGSVGLWTEQTIKNYINQTKCIIDQYSRFKPEQIELNVNGSQTQGENIADNGGIKESFRAYQKWTTSNEPEPTLPGLKYNQQQLFFINYAQVWCAKMTDQELRSRILNGVHSPGEFRVVGPTANTEFFADAFSCKPKQPNNPENKCKVW